MADDSGPFPGDPLRGLQVSPAVKKVLLEIRAEIADAYRDYFFALVKAMEQQASALARIQTTLNVLVSNLDLKDAAGLPIAIQQAGDGERPDLAKALVLKVADPIAAGFTLTQSALAAGLGLSQADVSVLVRAFGIDKDGNCAVTVRQGRRHPVVNYHARAVERFKEMVANPPKSLDRTQLGALRRVRKTLPKSGKT